MAIEYDLLSVGTGLALAIVTIATQMPKLLAGLKRDKLDNTVATTQIDMVDSIQLSYEKQIASLNARIDKQDVKLDIMNGTIHLQSVKVTRLIVVVLHMKGLMSQHSLPVPDNILSEIEQLTNIEVTGL